MPTAAALPYANLPLGSVGPESIWMDQPQAGGSTKTVRVSPADLVASVLAIATVTAAGNSQATATPLPAVKNIVRSAPAGTAVVLVITAGGAQKVFGRAGAAIKVFPSLGTQVEGNALNAAVSVANGDDAEFTFDPLTSTWLAS